MLHTTHKQPRTHTHTQTDKQPHTSNSSVAVPPPTAKQVPSSDSSPRPALHTCMHLTYTHRPHMHARASLYRQSHESGVTGPWSRAIPGKCSANCRPPTVGERCDSSSVHMEPETESSATHRTSGGKSQRASGGQCGKTLGTNTTRKEKRNNNNNTLRHEHERRGASVEELVLAAGRRHTQTGGAVSVTAD